MDVGVSTEFQIMFALAILSTFIVGFVPGFYLTLLLLLKKLKINLNYSFPFSFFSGILTGILSYNLFLNSNLTQTKNIYIIFFINSLFYIVGLEILIVLVHFFFIFNRKKKRIR